MSIKPEQWIATTPAEVWTFEGDTHSNNGQQLARELTARGVDARYFVRDRRPRLKLEHNRRIASIGDKIVRSAWNHWYAVVPPDVFAAHFTGPKR